MRSRHVSRAMRGNRAHSASSTVVHSPRAKCTVLAGTPSRESRGELGRIRSWERNFVCVSMRAFPRSAAMPQILVDNLEKRFRVAARDPGMWGAVRGLVRRRYREVIALHGVSFGIEARRDRRLHRSERRRQVDHDQDPVRHPHPLGRSLYRQRTGAVARSHRARCAHRRGVRSTHAAVVGPAGGRVVRSAARHLSRCAEALRTRARGTGRAAESRTVARRAGASAQPRPAHALRSRGVAAARTGHRVPRRADHRSGRGVETRDPRLRRGV